MAEQAHHQGTDTAPTLDLPPMEPKAGDCNEPDTQLVAKGFWPEFEDYMELRRLDNLSTMTLSQSGRYPIALPPDPTAEQRSKVCKSLAFAAADSLILRQDCISAGEIDRDMEGVLATQLPIDMPHGLTADEMAMITRVAFVLAYTYRTSDMRLQIEKATSSGSGDDTIDPDEYMPHERHHNRHHLGT